VLVTLCLTALGSSGISQAQAATAPPGFFGLGGWSYPTETQATTLGNAGVRSYRAGLVWDDIERRQGTRNWGGVDQLVSNAARSGADVLLVFNGCARWACGATRVPPADGPQMDAFRQFVAAAVQRYGHGGTFWATHPALTPHPVSWQVWNEVNAGVDWPNPTAAAYASFLTSVSSTIKAVDPQSTVVASGLTEYPAVATGVTGALFLDQLYDQPGFAASFDVVAAHAYAADTAGSVRILDAMRKVMLDRGDGRRPLWVTELGWADAGPSHPFVRDAAGQAAELRHSFDTLLGCRSRWNLDRVMWFSIQDARPASLGEPDYWGMHTGLLTADGAPKPALDAFEEYVGGAPLPNGRADGCGLPGATALDTTVPDTAITGSPEIVGGGQPAAVSFGASEADAHFECALDGTGWTPCATSLPVATTREGSHEMFVRAVDAQGNVDPTPARATWMVDLSPPDTTVTKRPPSNTTTGVAAVEFTGRDAVGTKAFQCRSDTAAWTPCASPYRSPSLKAGRHQISIRAIDFAGNVQVHPTTLTFTAAAPKPTTRSRAASTTCAKTLLKRRVVRGRSRTVRVRTVVRCPRPPVTAKVKPRRAPRSVHVKPRVTLLRS
jgi:hypothetical protein